MVVFRVKVMGKLNKKYIRYYISTTLYAPTIPAEEDQNRPHLPHSNAQTRRIIPTAY